MKRALACLCIVLASAWAFAPVADNAFVNYDDPKYLTENPHVQRGLTLDGFVWAFDNRQTANFHPLTWLSHMLDVELFGLDPAAHHLVSLALHALAACALCLALAALGLPLASALLVALLFALHPLRVESVAWAAERKDVLSGLLFALTLGAWSAWARHGRRLGYALAWLAFLLGLCAKSMLVTLPAVLLLLDVWPLARVRGLGWRRLVLEKLPFAALALACAGLTLFTQHAAGAVRDTQRIALLARVANALRAVGAYLAQTFVPHDLAVFYPHPAIVRPEASPWSASLLVTLAAVLALSALAWRVRARLPALGIGWLWFLGMLLPVLGLVQVGEQARADRYTYLPSIGLGLALVGTLDVLSAARPALRRGLFATAVLALALGTLATRAQARVWRDSGTLFRHALDVDEQNPIAHFSLACALIPEGRLDEARAHLERALALQPDHANAHYNLGVVLQGFGQPDAARASFERTLALRPDHADAHVNLGLALGLAGEHERALVHLQAALRFAPENARAHASLGTIARLAGEVELAERALGQALRLDPSSASAHYQMGRVQEERGQARLALRHFDAALQLDPGARDTARRFAWIAATTDASAQDRRKGLAIAQALVQAGGERDAAALDVLAASLAASGDFRAAEAAQERALAIGGDEGREQRSAWLERYRAGLSLAPAAQAQPGLQGAQDR